MKRLLVGCFLTIAMLTLSVAQAQEEKCHITRYNGELIRNAEITKMSKDLIQANVSGSTERIPVGDVKSIMFTGEPAELQEARDFLPDSRFEDMLDKLKEVDPNQLTENMKRERDFLIVRALAGRAFNGSLPISNVIKEMDKYFKKEENQNFYRFYELTEIYGDLNVLIGTDEALTKAGNAFMMLSKAKDAPILKARGLLGASTIAIAKGDATTATKACKEVLSMVKNQELEGVKAEMEVGASCGLARAEVLEGKTEQAIKDIKAIFAASKISAEDPLNARLYNALGYALLASKKPKDAAIAYMHTHLLFNGNKQLHIEALDAMIKIFRQELRDEKRATELQGIKDARYGGKKK